MKDAASALSLYLPYQSQFSSLFFPPPYLVVWYRELKYPVLLVHMQLSSPSLFLKWTSKWERDVGTVLCIAYTWKKLGHLGHLVF